MMPWPLTRRELEMAGGPLRVHTIEQFFDDEDPPKLRWIAEFRRDLHLLLADSAATMILVTHDPIDALALGRRVGVLGDGRLQQLGTPEQLRHRPGNRFVSPRLTV